MRARILTTPPACGPASSNPTLLPPPGCAPPAAAPAGPFDPADNAEQHRCCGRHAPGSGHQHSLGPQGETRAVFAGGRADPKPTAGSHQPPCVIPASFEPLSLCALLRCPHAAPACRRRWRTRSPRPLMDLGTMCWCSGRTWSSHPMRPRAGRRPVASSCPTPCSCGARASAGCGAEAGQLGCCSVLPCRRAALVAKPACAAVCVSALNMKAPRLLCPCAQGDQSLVRVNFGYARNLLVIPFNVKPNTLIIKVRPKAIMGAWNR